MSGDGQGAGPMWSARFPRWGCSAYFLNHFLHINVKCFKCCSTGSAWVLRVITMLTEASAQRAADRHTGPHVLQWGFNRATRGAMSPGAEPCGDVRSAHVHGCTPVRAICPGAEIAFCIAFVQAWWRFSAASARMNARLGESRKPPEAMSAEEGGWSALMGPFKV